MDTILKAVAVVATLTMIAAYRVASVFRRYVLRRND